MTDQQINIAIAESLGAKQEKYSLYGDEPTWVFKKYFCALVDLPRYTTSLDACAEFEATLTRDEQYHYDCYLFKQCVPMDRGDVFDPDSAFLCITATPRQRCEAYLRTKGLWQEDAP